jgi:hypothetical protein
MNDDSLMRSVTPYSRQHPRLIARVRVGVGVWLLILTGILCGYGRSDWLAALLVPIAGLHFYLAYRVPRAIATRTTSTDAA